MDDNDTTETIVVVVVVVCYTQSYSRSIFVERIAAAVTAKDHLRFVG